MPRRLFVVLGILFFGFFQTGFSQKKYNNKIQYKTHDWLEMEKSNQSCIIYYPKGYDELASFLSFHIDDIQIKIAKTFSLGLSTPLNIFIYPTVEQLSESNIGIYEKGYLGFSIISHTNNRIAVGFNGSHQDMINDVMKAMIMLSIKKAVPSFDMCVNGTKAEECWFFEGVSSYIVHGWNMEDEEFLRTIYQSKSSDFFDWEQINNESSYILAKSFIYFLEQQYRADVLKQIIFHMSSGKNFSKSIRLVLYISLPELEAAYIAYYKNRFEEDITTNEKKWQAEISLTEERKLIKKIRKEKGTTEIHLVGKRTTKILAVFPTYQGSDITKISESYPLIYNDKVNNTIGIINYEKGKIILRRFFYNGAAIDKKELKGLDGLRHFIMGRNGMLWMSAYKLGRSDIIKFYTGSNISIPVTDDIADQFMFVMNEQENEIIYKSGFPFTIIEKDTIELCNGLYRKQLGNEASDEAVLLLKDSLYYEWNPLGIKQGQVVVHHNISGFYQRDSFQRGNVTSIENARLHNISNPSAWLIDWQHTKTYRDSINVLLSGQSAAQHKNTMQSIFDINHSNEKDTISKAVSRNIVNPYVLRLYKAYFSGGINNDYFINKYQPFRAYSGVYKFPELSGLISGGMSDIFENHHLSIGYKLPISFKGSDFFISYRNLKKRLDWNLIYFRKSELVSRNTNSIWVDEQQFPYPSQTKVVTDNYAVNVTYPLNHQWSIGAGVSFRSDKTIFLSTDNYSLEFADKRSWWSMNQVGLYGGKIHLLKPMMKKGWEFSTTLDFMATKDQNSSILTCGLLSAYKGYFNIKKRVLIEPQIQVGWSGGSQKILYLFGGVDGNLTPLSDTAIYFEQDAPYSFQTLVTPFRGYRQNSIYGYGFGMINMDMFVPVFNEQYKWKPRISAIANIQIGCYADYVKVMKDDYPSLPYVPSSLYSVGLSMRTVLAGIPIRFDYSLPVSGGVGFWYLSANSTF